MNFPTARHRFHQEIHRPEAEIDLAAAALYIAAEEYPDLDVAAHLNTLDRMGEAMGQRLPQQPYPLKILKALNEYLFDHLGFVGNSEDYYDPRNSYLNQVLERRTGIPITLSLIYLEVARRIGFPMAGVAMPGHFLIRPTAEDMDIYVDPFHRGEIMFEQDCQDRLRQIYGQEAQLRSQHLTAISPKMLLARMLSNLKLIYLHQRNVDKALGAIDRILMIFPQSTELRDRGLLYYQQGHTTQAQRDLEAYLWEWPDASDAFEIRQVLNQIERTED